MRTIVKLGVGLLVCVAIVLAAVSTVRHHHTVPLGHDPTPGPAVTVPVAGTGSIEPSGVASTVPPGPSPSSVVALSSSQMQLLTQTVEAFAQIYFTLQPGDTSASKTDTLRRARPSLIAGECPCTVPVADPKTSLAGAQQAKQKLTVSLAASQPGDLRLIFVSSNQVRVAMVARQVLLSYPGTSRQSLHAQITPYTLSLINTGTRWLVNDIVPGQAG